LPLNFLAGDSADSLGLDGTETYSITGLGDGSAEFVDVVAESDDGKQISFQAQVRLDTPKEIEYYQHGGILHYVLRQLAAEG